MRQVRLTVEEEQDLAREIIALEQEIAALVAPIPECNVAVRARRGRVGRTRAAMVDGLEVAVRALEGVTRSPQTVASIRAKWARSEQLRWRLAMSACSVVYREARRLASNPTVAEPDLIQEGFVGLLGAAKRYEPQRETRFATYARWWVRAQMTRAVDLGRLVHLSAGAGEQLRNIRKQIRIYDTTGSPWTSATLAEDLGLEVARVQYLLSVGPPQSLDEPGTDDDAERPISQLCDETSPLPDDVFHQRQRAERLQQVLTRLPPRLQRVVTRRYGLGREPMTLADIASGMALSRERVRQLEHQSLALLREACAAD